MSVKIDLSLDEKFHPLGIQRMKDSYLTDKETSPQERFKYVAETFANDAEMAQRLYYYISNFWLSLSTPILNFREGKLPISCYLIYVEDNIQSIINSLSEANSLSFGGGGVSVKLNIRPSSEKSVGIIPHIKTYDACMMAYKQGARRGSYSINLDINHPEILQFLDIRKPTGDYNLRCMNVHHTINITDDFMAIIEKCTQIKNFNDDWPLIDPHTKKITEIVSAKKLWETILERRLETGEPFICWIDTCNKNMNPLQKDKGMKIQQTNLCTEIIVPTNETRSSVCCLSSVNLEYWDEWKNNKLFFEDIGYMLNNVLEKFITTVNSPSFADIKHNFIRTLDSVVNEKNIGVGVMGFHAYLQKNNVSIESGIAATKNIEMFKHINERMNQVNLKLGKEYGSPNDILGSGKRFSYVMAVAPTASSSIIVGNTSPSIEPYNSNYYRQDTTSGFHVNKNKFLDELFRKKKFSKKLVEEKLWPSILQNKGSVLHLPSGILSKEEKDVFKTAFEIDQNILVKLAVDRQKYIDQAQSFTIFIDNKYPIEKLHKIHMDSYKGGLKTMYYIRSTKAIKTEIIGEEIKFLSCEGCE